MQFKFRKTSLQIKKHEINLWDKIYYKNKCHRSKEATKKSTKKEKSSIEVLIQSFVFETFA